MFYTTTCEQKPHDEPNNKKIIKVNVRIIPIRSECINVILK